MMMCEASEVLIDVGGADVAGEFLVDPLKQPLGAGALDLHGDAGIGGLERLAEFFADRQVHRRIEDQLAFLLRRFHQRRRDRDRLGRLGANGRGEYGSGRQRDRALQDVAS